MFQFEEVHELYGNHLEADIRVMFHVNHADKNSNGNIIVRGNDTDIAIILTCNGNLLTSSHLWYDFGTDYNNSCEYLDVTKFSKSLTYAQVLPSIYAFTGNDYSPSFYRKGKTRPITVMNKHEKFNSFMALCDLPLTNEIINIIEEITCHLYDYTKQTNIHDVINIHFGNRTKPKTSQKPLGKHQGY